MKMVSFELPQILRTSLIVGAAGVSSSLVIPNNDGVPLQYYHEMVSIMNSGNGMVRTNDIFQFRQSYYFGNNELAKSRLKKFFLSTSRGRSLVDELLQDRKLENLNG
jgi:hypothetical protein